MKPTNLHCFKILILFLIFFSFSKAYATTFTFKVALQGIFNGTGHNCDETFYADFYHNCGTIGCTNACTSLSGPIAFTVNSLTLQGSLTVVLPAIPPTDIYAFKITCPDRSALAIWGERTSPLPAAVFYDFTNIPSHTYGIGTFSVPVNCGGIAYDNLIKVSSTPVWAMLSGDTDQDGVIDATDLGIVSDDASGFTTGNVSSDLNCDQFVDATDVSIEDNNVQCGPPFVVNCAAPCVCN